MTAATKGTSNQQLYERNQKVLSHHAKTLQDLGGNFTVACDKLGKWLADDRAFYTQVQPLVQWIPKRREHIDSHPSSVDR
jgi:hypothetical protein